MSARTYTCSVCSSGRSCGCNCLDCVRELQAAQVGSQTPMKSSTIPKGPAMNPAHEPTPEQKKLGLTNTKYLNGNYDPDWD